MELEEDIIWDVVGLSAGLLAATVGRKAFASGWKTVTGRDVPDNPAAPGVSWPEAIGFAVCSGAMMGLVRLLAQRGAAGAWRAAAGDYPAALREPRS